MKEWQEQCLADLCAYNTELFKRYQLAVEKPETLNEILIAAKDHLDFEEAIEVIQSIFEGEE